MKGGFFFFFFLWIIRRSESVYFCKTSWVVAFFLIAAYFCFIESELVSAYPCIYFLSLYFLLLPVLQSLWQGLKEIFVQGSLSLAELRWWFCSENDSYYNKWFQGLKSTLTVNWQKMKMRIVLCRKSLPFLVTLSHLLCISWAFVLTLDFIDLFYAFFVHDSNEQVKPVSSVDCCWYFTNMPCFQVICCELNSEFVWWGFKETVKL